MMRDVGPFIAHLRRHQRAYLLPLWLAVGILWIAGAISLAALGGIGLALGAIHIVLAEGKHNAAR